MLTEEAVPIMVKVMAPYIGETMARSAAQAQCEKLGVQGGTLGPVQLESLLAKLGSGLNIFLGRDKSTQVITEVRRALADQAER